jgi:hypothetical protein
MHKRFQILRNFSVGRVARRILMHLIQTLLHCDDEILLNHERPTGLHVLLRCRIGCVLAKAIRKLPCPCSAMLAKLRS